MKPDNFIDIPFTEDNLDLFVVRNSILKAIDGCSSVFTGKLLDMGCGKMPYRDYLLRNSAISSYTGLDIATAIVYDQKVKPDFTWDGVKMPFEDSSYDTILATEVFEHCPDLKVTLKEAYRVLRPGGYIFFTTPFFWNLHEVPHDEYRLTPFSLKRHLQDNGFSEIDVRAAGGWHASMAQMLGLWVRRSSLSPRQRKWYSRIAKPIMRRLLEMDRKSKIDFMKAPMLTTLYGTARK